MKSSDAGGLFLPHILNASDRAGVTYDFIPTLGRFLGTEDGAPVAPLILLAVVPLFFSFKRTRRPPWVLTLLLLTTVGLSFSLEFFSSAVGDQSDLLFPVVSLTVIGIELLGGIKQGRRRRTIYRLIFTAHSCLSGYLCIQMLEESDAAAFLSKQVSRTEYLAEALPEYSMLRYVNDHLPATAVVYLLYTGNDYYYYARTVRGSEFPRDSNVIVEALKADPSADAVLQALKAQGITHLVIDQPALVSTFKNVLNAAERRAWLEFFRRYMSPVHQENDLSLWRVNAAG